MSTETTPLTSTVPPPGPACAFPGGVSPRLRNRKMRQFQCCLSTALLGIVLIALAVTISLLNTDQFWGKSSTLSAEHVYSGSESMLNASEVLSAMTLPIADERPDAWALIKNQITADEFEEAVSFGVKALGDRELFEENLPTTPVKSPAFRHYRSLSTNVEARKLTRRGSVECHATMYLAKRFNYTKLTGRSNIGNGPKVLLFDPTLNFTCDFNERYRRSNGMCNNKHNPRTHGAAMNPYRRAVAPDYGDGISLPRISHFAKELPAARHVSLHIHRASYATDSNFTVMLAVFGQFLDHDITATSLSASQEGESINCCTLPLNEHPECFPVPVGPGDPYYDKYNVTCMNFVRSAPAPTGIFGPRQQLNQATAFIDGSAVYGNTDQRQNILRTNKNGALRMFTTNDGRELLPLSTNPDDGCNREEMNTQGKYCFESGDDRSNENLLLASMHLIFARHHNYLANGLQAANPSWNDEIVYQESRKILGAQIQHITYNEFLPILLGKNLSKNLGILSDTNLNAPDTYDPQIDATIANNFAASAFRFAHTLLPSLFNMTRDNSSVEAVELHKMLFNPYSLWAERGVDKAINTAVNTPVSRVDRFFTIELTEKLFQDTTADMAPICGLDLVSLNIQRGRDHGLPSYPVFRQHCKLPPVNNWKQMEKALDKESLSSIKQSYNSPNDVDLYTGALSEPPLEGAIFGPLLTCLVSDQFVRLKRGDSHWYERKSGSQRFTKDQLSEIYKTSLAGIICKNSDDIQKIRRFVMERRGGGDSMGDPIIFTNCAEIMHFNFTPWSGQSKERILLNSSVSMRATPPTSPSNN